jgi:hypothetical protein
MDSTILEKPKYKYFGTNDEDKMVETYYLKIDLKFIDDKPQITNMTVETGVNLENIKQYKKIYSDKYSTGGLLDEQIDKALNHINKNDLNRKNTEYYIMANIGFDASYAIFLKEIYVETYTMDVNSPGHEPEPEEFDKQFDKQFDEKFITAFSNKTAAQGMLVDNMNAYKKTRMIANFIKERFLRTDILSAEIDRLLFRNQEFIQFVNTAITDGIYSEMKEKKNIDKSTLNNLFNAASYVPGLNILKMLYERGFSFRNGLFNDIKNVPFSNNALFELFNTYKYQVKKVYANPLNVARHHQLRYFLKVINSFLTTNDLMNKYRTEMVNFGLYKHTEEEKILINEIEVSDLLTNSVITNVLNDGVNIIGNDFGDVDSDDEVSDVNDDDDDDEVGDDDDDSDDDDDYDDQEGGLKTRKYKQNHKNHKINTRKYTKIVGGIGNAKERVKDIIIQKINKYIDISDIQDMYKRKYWSGNHGPINVASKNYAPHYTKKETIIFLVRTIIYFKILENKENKEIILYDDKKIQLSVAIQNIKDIKDISSNDILGWVGISENAIYDLIDNGLPEYLKTINVNKYSPIIINDTSGVSLELERQTEIIKKLLETLASFRDVKYINGHRMHVGGAIPNMGIKSNIEEKLKGVTRFSSNILNNMYAATHRDYMIIIRNAFYYSHEAMIDNQFKKLTDAIKTDNADKSVKTVHKDEVVEFFTKLTWSTLKLGHFTCSSFSNFLSMRIKELTFLTMFTVHNVAISLGYQALNCFVSFLIMSYVFWELSPLNYKQILGYSEDKTSNISPERKLAIENAEKRVLHERGKLSIVPELLLPVTAPIDYMRGVKPKFDV